MVLIRLRRVVAEKITSDINSKCSKSAKESNVLLHDLHGVIADDEPVVVSMPNLNVSDSVQIVRCVSVEELQEVILLRPADNKSILKYDGIFCGIEILCST